MEWSRNQMLSLPSPHPLQVHTKGPSWHSLFSIVCAERNGEGQVAIEVGQKSLVSMVRNGEYFVSQYSYWHLRKFL